MPPHRTKRKPYPQFELNAPAQRKAPSRDCFSPSLKPLSFAFACGGLLSLSALPAHAAPTGGQVSAGSAAIQQADAATTITQSSQNAAINWQGFSIGKGESVSFQQPNASAVTLNRVVGAEQSAIQGALNANGRVFILNPNGVLIGNGAQINVGGFLAPTQSMRDADFMAGNYRLIPILNH